MPNISLLAPVPLEHLIDACTLCRAKGKVAFGSRAWQVFRELDIAREGETVETYIYASGDKSFESFEVSWYGRYIGHVEGNNGAHPDGMLFRPASTTKDPRDNKGHWAVFWELDQLRQLQPHERISTGEFHGFESGKKYKKHFTPQGPIIVLAHHLPH